MASRFPVVAGREAVRALERAGFTVHRVRGSHHVMRRVGAPNRYVTVPVHRGKELRRKTVSSILGQAGLTIEEFVGLL